MADEFEAEVLLYRNPVLARTLPQLLHASDNSTGSARSRSGFTFPPFLILERGITLDAWAAQGARGFGEVLTMLEHVAELLRVLHDAGLVHRDVKPANTLFLLHSLSWKLLDVGIVERTGAAPLLPCAASVL